MWREFHRLNNCIGAIVILLSVSIMSCDDNSDTMPFESEAWKAGSKTSGHLMSWDNPSTRFRMSRDIVENHRMQFEGQPKKRIIEMLGLPESDSTPVFLFDYYEEKCGDGWNSIAKYRGKGFSMYYELGILESPYFDELQILELEYDSAGIIHSVVMSDR